MKTRIGRFIGLSAFAMGLVLLATPAIGAVRPMATTYTFTFFEVGLAPGTTWSVTFNSGTSTTTGTSINFTAVSAGSYYWSSSATVSSTKTTVEFVTTATSGYTTVPNQKAQYIPYVKEYQVTTLVTPSGSGTAGPASGFYPAGSQVAFQSSAYWGYNFVSWKSNSANVTLDSTTSPSTVATVNAPATITAKFSNLKYAFTFTEVGLPAGTSWSPIFGGSSFPGTTTSIKTSTHFAGSYSFSVPTVLAPKGVEYVPTPSYGYVSVPAQPSVEIVFVKEFQVYFATNPASSGSLNLYSPTYYPNGTQLPIDAFNTGGYGFVSWSTNNSAIGIGTKTSPSTNATIGGSGGITAKFTTATACSANCTLTFTEVGLPAGTSWGLYVNSIIYTSTTTTITVKKLNAAASWSALSPVGSSSTSSYYASPYGSSGYISLGYTNSQIVVFNHYYYVNIVSNPLYTGAYLTLASGWFLAGSTQPISAQNTATWNFASYGSSTPNLVLSSTKTSASSFLVNGAGTITATFKNPKATFTFEEFNLPAGTTWGVSIGGFYYLTNTTELNVTLPMTGYYAYPLSSLNAGVAGTQYLPTVYYNYVNAPFSTFQTIVYVEQFQVTFAAGGTTGGSVLPGASSYWFNAGSVVAISAVNGTTVHFKSWSATTTSGSIPIASTTSPSTVITVTGTGTVTAKFA